MIKNSGCSLTWRMQTCRPHRCSHWWIHITIPHTAWFHELIPLPQPEGASWAAWACQRSQCPMLGLRRVLPRPQGECAQQRPKTTGTRKTSQQGYRSPQENRHKEDTPVGIQVTPRQQAQERHPSRDTDHPKMTGTRKTPQQVTPRALKHSTMGSHLSLTAAAEQESHATLHGTAL